MGSEMCIRDSVNLVAGEGAALDGFEAYLGNAPGITGQYFESDGTGAGDPLVEPS